MCVGKCAAIVRMLAWAKIVHPSTVHIASNMILIL